MTAMFRFGSKKDLSSELIKCTIRLLDDNEVLECEFNVSFVVWFL